MALSQTRVYLLLKECVNKTNITTIENKSALSLAAAIYDWRFTFNGRNPFPFNNHEMLRILMERSERKLYGKQISK